MNVILVTKSFINSKLLTEKLQKKGYDTLSFPLFKIVKKKPNFLTKFFIKKNKSNSFILTSANSIFYLNELNLSRNVEIFSIGDKTSKLVKELGFCNVKTASGNVNSLIKLILKKFNNNGLLIYLSGRIISKNIVGELSKKGFKAKRIVVYKTLEVKNIPDDIIGKIKSGTIKYITIYSKNTAKILLKIFKKYNLLEYSMQINLLCLSDEIVKFCYDIGFTKCDNINKIIK